MAILAIIPTFITLFSLISWVTGNLIKIQLNKIHIPLPDIPTRLLQNYNTKSINLLDFDYIGNVGKVQIGSNAATFNIIFDTGSSWFWLPDITAKEVSHSKYNCSSSTTCLPSTTKVSINDTEWGLARDSSGYIVYEDVSFGSNFTILNQSILLVTEFDELGMLKLDIDGYCGLGFNDTINGYSTILDTFYDQGLIQNKTFSIYVFPEHRHVTKSKKKQPSDNKKSRILQEAQEATSEIILNSKEYNATSELIFGGYETDYMLTPFVFLDIIDNSSWTIALDSAISRNQSFPSESKKAVIVTGTHNLQIPTYDYDSFISILSEEYNITFSGSLFLCEDIDLNTLPSFGFSSGGLNLSIPAEDYIEVYSPWCQLAIDYQDEMENTWILGEAFLRNYYTYFDIDNKKIGFALAAVPQSKVLSIATSWALFFYSFPLFLLGTILTSLIYKFCYEDLSPRAQGYQKSQGMQMSQFGDYQPMH